MSVECCVWKKHQKIIELLSNAFNFKKKNIKSEGKIQIRPGLSFLKASPAIDSYNFKILSYMHIQDPCIKIKEQEV
jgi:hypothetical protein